MTNLVYLVLGQKFKDKEEGAMLTMAQVEDIREAFFRKGKSITVIAREQNLDRKTVRKYISMDDFNEDTSDVVSKEPRLCPKLDSFKPVIDSWLEDDKRAKRKQRHTAKRVYARLSTEDGTKDSFDCSYRTVAEYVSWKKKQIYSGVIESAIPLIHKPGEAQVDFGAAQFIEAGELIDGHYLNVSFPNSNQGFQQLCYGENTECLLEGLVSIFNHIGGVPNEMWFDNLSPVVSKIIRGGGRNITDRFLRFKNHYGFDSVFCNPAKGNEKGNVENKVGYHRRNMLVPIPEFISIEEFNMKLLDMCDEDGRRDHYRKDGQISDLFKADKSALLPLARGEFDLADYKYLKTDKYGKFSLDKGLHEYSSSPSMALKKVIVRLSSLWVSVMDEERREIVTHKRLYGDKHESRMDWSAYLNQLAVRPRAIKYSGVYELMPPSVIDFLDTLTGAEIGNVLRTLAKLAETSGFEGAVNTIAAAVDAGANDVDSIVSIHRRITGEIPVLPKIDTADCIKGLIKTNPKLSIYDAVLDGGRSYHA